MKNVGARGKKVAVKQAFFIEQLEDLYVVYFYQKFWNQIWPINQLTYAHEILTSMAMLKNEEYRS